MPETTENYHRIPVSSGHSSHEIRTIDIDSDRGIKALYCTDCKEVVTYLFDTDQWTMAEAQEWIDSHKGLDVGDMSTKLDRRTKDKIGSNVRYKSYGTFGKSIDKNAGGGGDMLVRGFFTSDEKDEVGDIITRAATKKAIEKWRAWGNIRTMHDYPSGRVSAIGEGDGLAWNEVVTVPVDEGTKKLIEGGVLKAYSVGIIPRRYELNEEALSDSEDDWFLPLIIHEYDMVEISYVDHPANYSATISDVSSGKMAGFGDRAVVFKNLNTSGEDSSMDMEKDVNAEAVDESADVDGDVTDNTEPVSDDAVDSNSAAESAEDNDESPVDEKVNDDEDSNDESGEDKDPAPDVFKAVQDIGGRIGGLEDQISQVADKVDSLVGDVVDAFMTALSEAGKVIASNEAVDTGEESANTEKSIDVDALTKEITESVIKGLAEALAPEVTRSAHVAVDSDNGDGETSLDKTLKYLAMTPEQRRQKMKELLDRK